MPMKYLDLTLLQAFTAVIDSGSFTLAARYLCRTQSAVSMQIRKLEETVGRALLQPDRRNIRLTEEGEVLLDYARRMIRLNEDALVAMDQPFAEGHVRLGLPDDYAEYFLPEVLARFAHAYPRVQLEVIGALSGDLLDRVEAGALDVALITRQPNGRQGEFCGASGWCGQAPGNDRCMPSRHCRWRYFPKVVYSERMRWPRWMRNPSLGALPIPAKVLQVGSWPFRVGWH